MINIGLMEDDLHLEGGDILILDIELPEMTGIELAKKLRNRGKKSYIVFLQG